MCDDVRTDPRSGRPAWYWHRLVSELERRGHEAIAVDLPAGDGSAGLTAYADTVVAAAADRGPVVVVAQSMGGLTAPLVCDRLPVRALVLVNAMIPLPGETGGEWWTATRQGEARAAHAEREGRRHDPDDLTTAFFRDVPADVAAAAQALTFAQSDRPFGEPWPLRRWPDVPTHVLAGEDDRFFPTEFQRRVAAERWGLAVEEIPGGHLVALSRPVQLADRLEACLDHS